MIDYINFLITDSETQKRIKNNEKLYWVQDIDSLNIYDKETIQTSTNKYFRDNKLIVSFNESNTKILFKPHYFYNDSLHNANDFTISNCIETCHWLFDEFEIPPELAKPINFEYGINMNAPIPGGDLITFTKYHGRNEFVNHPGLRYSKVSSSTKPNGKLNNYKQIKFYWKGLQFPKFCSHNTVRFEVRSKRTKFINSIGIKTGSDLLHSETYAELSKSILKEFKSLLILDHNASPKLTNRETERFKNYLNSDTWYKYTNASRNVFSRKRKDYLTLLSKDENNIYSQLEGIVINKINDLKPCAISTPYIIEKPCANSTLSIKEICTHFDNEEQRFCILTGYEISMQKDESNLLSHTGLRYYLEKDSIAFKTIRRKFLSDNWKNYNVEVQIKEIAHNIRNHYYNRLRKQKYLYPKNQFTLFANYR